MASVSTLKLIDSPRPTLMSVAKPWMLGSPAPATSHSLAGFPGSAFSATIAFWARAMPALRTSAHAATDRTPGRLPDGVAPPPTERRGRGTRDS